MYDRPTNIGDVLMTRKRDKMLLFLLILASSSSAVLAAPPAPQSQIPLLRPFELSSPQAHRHHRPENDPRGNVRRRVEYGKPFQFGRRVSGPMGDIIIWSPAVDDSYGKPPPPRFGPRQPERFGRSFD